MTNATAVIKRDHLDGRYTGKVLTWGEGCTIGEALIGSGAVRDRFQLIDDDGELYYSGTILRPEGDEDVYDLLFDWGMADSGTTVLWVNGEVVIG